MSEEKNQVSIILEDLEVNSEDMMSDPKAFIVRIIKKSKELAAILDSKSTISEHERVFKEKAYKNEAAKDKAQEIFDSFYSVIVEQEPEVLVNLLTMFADLISVANSSVRSMSMRTSGSAALSKKQINLLYIKLKKTYETYISFMKLFHSTEIGMPPVIPPKKGNFSSDYSSSGIKTFEYILDGLSFINPFVVANKLGLKVSHYMDLSEEIVKIQKENPGELINGYKVELKDISPGKDEDKDVE